MKRRIRILRALGVGALGIGIAVLATGLRDSGAHSQDRRVLDACAKLPITFVENRGQADKHVRYLAQGPGYSFFLTPSEVVLSLSKTSRIATADHQANPSPDGVALALQFLRANPGVSMEGAARAPGNVNFFRGDDPANWRTDVPSYGQVVYRELWHGIDLKLCETHGTLKYEFHVRPGANVADIGLAYRGARGLTQDSSGGMLIQTELGTLHDSAPVSYQEIDGVRVPVESRYVLGAKSYGF